MEMNLYEGTKQLRAKPMTRGEYNAYRGWGTPEGENPDDAGYLVEYVNGGKPNDERHTGYISWSPKDVFESTYKPIDVKLSYSDINQLHDLLYSAQRTTGNKQMRAIGDARILLTRRMAAAARAKPLLAPWTSSVGVLWEVHAHGKPLGCVVSPLNWDADGVYQALVDAGYAHNVEVKLAHLQKTVTDSPTAGM